MSSRASTDHELDAVCAELRKLDLHGGRIAQVLRGTLDQLYDGQRTGRYRWDQLHKTEKTHCGSVIEMNLHREFRFQDGEKLDYRIAGIDVDCKYSQSLGGWMIPPEARGQLCLLVWADDLSGRWSIGIVRATEERLNTGGIRDREATFNESGRNAIAWLFKNAPLPPNILLRLDPATVNKIMSLGSGQKRINELFHVALGMKAGRAVVATVAQQDDYMKRLRGNGGARTALQPEGIIILGQCHSHGAIARELGVPEPEPGDSVSVRVAQAMVEGPGVTKIGSGFRRVAKASDPVIRAPILPRV